MPQVRVAVGPCLRVFYVAVVRCRPLEDAQSLVGTSESGSVQAVQDDALVIALVRDGEDLCKRTSIRGVGGSAPGVPRVMLTKLVNNQAVNRERPSTLTVGRCDLVATAVSGL
jgi:hypothetical protein